jgi:chitinase
LVDVCTEGNFDIVVISFVTAFPQAVGDYPATNFGNACGGAYPGTSFLGPCSLIEAGIKTCQASGKKVFLSLGGAAFEGYKAPPTTTVANYFAEFLWGAFGPSSAAPPASWVTAGSPRPFGDANVDGFDFDIENGDSSTYADTINRLRGSDLIGTNKNFWISAAPQCYLPDANLGTTLQKASVDFIFIQFYNNPSCSARTGVNDILHGTSGFTFTAWATLVTATSKNKNAKLYIGLVRLYSMLHSHCLDH